eukprot:4034972-Karenia_brevis.AAC.1
MGGPKEPNAGKTNRAYTGSQGKLNQDQMEMIGNGLIDCGGRDQKQNRGAQGSKGGQTGGVEEIPSSGEGERPPKSKSSHTRNTQ